jgi:CheY-like chemotaxis protein
VAKILVADDNSNIQKMVGLALKDQGIEVVAVGNGEAAVRKISDVRPDLVLADVFMPVRNGYEVCQYVKEDPKLAHIPVILLVGAFDPLDEQEAQRVGADGVLKKPFVPPDPLISMVKSALARAGVSLGGASPDKTPGPGALRGTDLLTPRVAALKSVSALESNSVPRVPVVEGDSFGEEVSSKPAPLKIESGMPVAFSNLLDGPVTQEDQEDEDPGYLPTVHPELATERDWRDPDAEQDVETEEEEETESAWRRGGAEEAFGEAASAGSARDWREPPFGQPGGRKTGVEPWLPTKEKTEFVEAAEVEETAVEAKVEPPAVHEVAAVTQEAVTNETRPLAGLKEPTSTPHTETAVETPAVDASETVPAAMGEKSVANAWFSPTASPWDAEVQKAGQLASKWDAPVPADPAPGAGSDSLVGSASQTVVVEDNGSEKERQAVNEYARKALEEAALPAVAVESIREEVAQVAGLTKHEEASAAAAGPTVARGAPSMDELVARVLAKMSPEVLQAVTREILKPVVEAIVRDELGSKKP